MTTINPVADNQNLVADDTQASNEDDYQPDIPKPTTNIFPDGSSSTPPVKISHGEGGAIDKYRAQSKYILKKTMIAAAVTVAILPITPFILVFIPGVSSGFSGSSGGVTVLAWVILVPATVTAFFAISFLNKVLAIIGYRRKMTLVSAANMGMEHKASISDRADEYLRRAIIALIVTIVLHLFEQIVRWVIFDLAGSTLERWVSIDLVMNVFMWARYISYLAVTGFGAAWLVASKLKNKF